MTLKQSLVLLRSIIGFICSILLLSDCDNIWNIGISQRAMIQKLPLHIVQYSTNIDDDLYFPFSNADCGRMLAIYVVTLSIF